MADINEFEYSSPWVVVTLFIGFVVFSLVFESLEHLLEHSIIHKRRWSVMHMMRRLKEEVLSVGLIAIVLVLIEPSLVQICVPAKWVEGNKKAIDREQKDDDKGRRLLSIGRDLLAEKAVKCPTGRAQLFTKEAIHSVHILIYTIVFFHVLLSFAFIILSLLRMSEWQHWEKDAQKGVLLKAKTKKMRVLGGSTSYHWLKVFSHHLTSAVSKRSYLAVRRLSMNLCEKELGCTIAECKGDFQFYPFSKYMMGEFMARFVSVSYLLWLLGAGLLVIRDPGHQALVMLVFSGASILVLLIISMKLHSVLVHLTVKAHFMFEEDIEETTAGQEGEEVSLKTRSDADTALYERMRQRVEAFQTVDDLFWFHRPGILLGAQKVIYFGTAVMLALIFSAFLGKKGSQKNVVDNPVVIAVMVVQGLLLLLNARNNLPVYVLVMMAKKDIGRVALRWMNEDKFLTYKVELSGHGHGGSHKKGGAAEGYGPAHQEFREDLITRGATLVRRGPHQKTPGSSKVPQPHVEAASSPTSPQNPPARRELASYLDP